MNYESKYCLSEDKHKGTRTNFAFDILFDQLEKELRCKKNKETMNETRYCKRQ